jgi:hypothetical protein
MSNTIEQDWKITTSDGTFKGKRHVSPEVLYPAFEKNTEYVSILDSAF